MLSALITAFAIFLGTKVLSWALGPTGIGRAVKVVGYGLAAVLVLGAALGGKGGPSEEERSEANIQSYQAPAAPSPYVVPKQP